MIVTKKDFSILENRETYLLERANCWETYDQDYSKDFCLKRAESLRAEAKAIRHAIDELRAIHVNDDDLHG
jgi:hypothetical protein